LSVLRVLLQIAKTKLAKRVLVGWKDGCNAGCASSHHKAEALVSLVVRRQHKSMTRSMFWRTYSAWREISRQTLLLKVAARADALQAAHTKVLFESDSYFKILQQERTRERDHARQEHEREVERESKCHRQDLQKNKGKMKHYSSVWKRCIDRLAQLMVPLRKTLSCDAS
jgi:hypothetical protein